MKKKIDKNIKRDKLMNKEVKKTEITKKKKLIKSKETQK